MLAAVALAASISISNIGENPMVFPCKPGKVLTYKAQGQWEEGTGPGTVIKKTIMWHTRFIRCSLSPTKAVAIVRGLPGDLAWYQPGTKPNIYAIIQTTKALFIQQITYNPDINLQKIEPDPDNQYLGFPIKIDTCAIRSDLRPDGGYCWLVHAIKHVAEKPIWTIIYGSLPDYSRIDFEPGIGITSYFYHHNGTIAEVRAHLVRDSTQKQAQ